MVIARRASGGPQRTIAGPFRVANKEALAFGAADTAISFTVETDGVLFFALVQLPNFTNAPTGTLSIDNDNDDEIYSKAALANNAKNKVNVCSDGNDVPLIGTNTVKLTLSGVPGGSGGTAYLTLYTV